MRAFFMCFDEVDSRTMSGVCANSKDVRWFVQLDVIVPEMCQKLRDLPRSGFNAVVLSVLLRVVVFSHMFGEVDIANCEMLSRRPVNIGLYGTSLRS